MGKTVKSKGEELYHLNPSFYSLRESSKAYHDLYSAILSGADDNLRAFSAKALRRFEYTPDPPCVIPLGCEDACAKLCADDIWSTPLYHKLLCDEGYTCGPIREDCDGATLLAAPHLGGVPLFLPAQAHGQQGHVLTKVATRRAHDQSVQGGMKPFRAGGRSCYWYEGNQLSQGRLIGPRADPTVYEIEET